MKEADPTLPSAVPAVTPTPYARPPTPDAFGAQVGGAIERLGDVGQQIAVQAKQTNDRFRVYDADLQHGSSNNDSLYGYTDEQGTQHPGYLQRMGKDAIDTRDIQQQLKKNYEDQVSQLSNDSQRKLFERTGQSRLREALATVERHKDQQVREWQGQTAEGAAKLALDNIAADHSPDNVERQIARAVGGNFGTQQEAVGPLEAYWRAQGLSPEAREAKLREFESHAYGTALNGYLSRPYNPDGSGGPDAAGAKAYLDQVRDKLGPQAKEMEKQVNEALKQQGVGTQARTIITGALGPTGRLDEQKAISALEQLPESPNRQAIEEEVHRRMALHQQGQKQVDDAAIARLEKAMDDSGGKLNKADPDYASLDDVGQAKAVAYGQRLQREATAQWLQQRSIARQGDADVRRDAADARRELKEQDTAAVKDFGGMADDPQAQLALDPKVAYPGASPNAIADIKKQQALIKKKLEGGGLVKAGEFNTIVSKQIGGIVRDKEEQKVFQGVMQRWYFDKDQHDGGKDEPSRKEVLKKISDELIDYQKSFGPTWYSKMKRYQIEAQGLDISSFQPAPLVKQTYEPNKAPGPGPAAGPTKQTPPGPGWVPRNKKDGAPIWFNPATGDWKPRS